MLIGWTTVETREQAETLARGLIEARLAACVQVDGPITSVYRWDNRVQTATEHRLTVKFLAHRQVELEAWLISRHPYETPEWMVLRADRVSEKYLSWAHANSTPAPL